MLVAPYLSATVATSRNGCVKSITACCRSTPRCSRCPVVLAARARARAKTRQGDTLIVEIFAGGATRELPPVVRDALLALEHRRDTRMTDLRELGAQM